MTTESHPREGMPEDGADYWLKHQVNRRITPEQFEEVEAEHNRR